ncbi:MAG TPA: hypothetical protein VGR97_03270 [Candidatus Acidoferrales bacterium]|nr:hypothetical protein [Candidatus Acidoferrales bacterium]
MRKACVFLLVAVLLVLGQPPRATIFGGVRVLSTTRQPSPSD